MAMSNMSDLEFTYSHAAILVSDIVRSAAFYERTIGWRQEILP